MDLMQILNTSFLWMAGCLIGLTSPVATALLFDSSRDARRVGLFWIVAVVFAATASLIVTGRMPTFEIVPALMVGCIVVLPLWMSAPRRTTTGHRQTEPTQ